MVGVVGLILNFSKQKIGMISSSFELMTSLFYMKTILFIAQMFIAISKYSVRFDLLRLFHIIFTSCNDVIHE